MDDSRVGAQVEVREAAFRKLNESVAGFVDRIEQLCGCIEECRNAPITNDEIAPLLRPAESALHRVMHPLSHNMVIAGNLFHRLDKREAIELLRIVHRALPPGGVLSFTADKEKHVRDWCSELGISKRNVTMQRDARALLVEIQKLQ